MQTATSTTTGDHLNDESMGNRGHYTPNNKLSIDTYSIYLSIYLLYNYIIYIYYKKLYIGTTVPYSVGYVKPYRDYCTLLFEGVV